MRILPALGLGLLLFSCSSRPPAGLSYEYHQELSHEDWTFQVSVAPAEAPPEGSFSVRVQHAFFMVTPVMSVHPREGRLVDCQLGNLDEDDEPELLVASRTTEDAPLRLSLFQMRGGTLYPVALADWRDFAAAGGSGEKAGIDKNGLSLCYTGSGGEQHCLVWNPKENRWSDGS